MSETSLDGVFTPALVVDGPQLGANLREMAARADRLGVQLRPHAKTHKSPWIAGRQLAHGAVGLTVATIAEAEGFAAAGITDLTLSSPPIGDERLERLVAVARRARVRVAVDSPEVVQALDRACARTGVAVRYLWELDCGVGRFGTPPGRRTAELVAGVAERTRHCMFEGLFTFGGHAYGAADRDGILAAARDEADAVTETADALAGLGVDVPVRSVGSTPTTLVMGPTDGITEIRPGNYVFYDATQVALGLVALEQCALSVLTTVLSRPAPDRLIIDAGSKALAAERMTTRTPGFGAVIDHPRLTVARLYEEQGIVISAGPCDIPTGARLRVVPNHACAAVNLHERMHVEAQDGTVEPWPVAIRGWDRAATGERPVARAAP